MDDFKDIPVQTHKVKLIKLVEELDLRIVVAASDMDTRVVTSMDVNRPGLQLTGFYDYFDRERIQVVGIVETTYLKSLTQTARESSLRELLSKGICAVVVCHGCAVLPELETLAKELDVCVLQSALATSYIMAALIGSLNYHLAPRCTRHGVLVEVYGEGLLIIGDSGVGKSETALELVKRGHRLIADDAVEIKRVSNKSLVGSAPEMIRYYMELRGIGIVDVRRLFGIGAVKETEKIGLVIKFENWVEGKAYDRMGLESESCEILGISCPQVTIPVRPGRNLAVILELAAMNNRQKRMGINSALELAEHHDRFIDSF